jgi:hypothetical protein
MPLTRPSNSPLFATDATLSGGPQVGLSTRLSPGVGTLAQGFWKGRKLPGRAFSYIVGTLGDWCSYLDQRTYLLQALNWTERIAIASTAANNSPVGMAFAPSMGGASSPLLCSVDGTRTLLSSDGQNWYSGAPIANVSTAAPEVAYGQLDGAPAFMTNASATNYYTSADGSVWTARSPLPASLVDGVPCYAESLNRWVAVKNGVPHYVTGSAVALGFGWTAATSNAATTSWASNSGGCKRLVWSGSLFVALPINSYNKCLTSPDGITWTERTLATGTWVGLAYSTYDQLWLAVGTGAGVYSSPDGITWTFVTSAVAVLNDLAVSGPLWVAPTNGGAFGGLAYSLDKGATWQYVATGKHVIATAGWRRIMGFSSRFIVAHVDGSNIEFALSLRAA